MKIDLIKKLEAARYDTIVILGIGGHIKVEDFILEFDEIDAETFANIMYATDQMSQEFVGYEKTDPTKIQLMIDKYDFNRKRHFNQVMDIFETYCGPNIIRF